MTMSAPLLPIPPLIAKGEGVELAEPIATPCWEVDDNSSWPEPLGVMVRLLLPVVPRVAGEPLPRLSVVAEIPRVEAEVIVAKEEAVRVVVPERVVVVLVKVVVEPRAILVVPTESRILLPFTWRLPPRVVNPVPVVIGALLTVLRLRREGLFRVILPVEPVPMVKL